MELELKEVLTKYKNYTLDLMNSLEKEDYDSLDGILNKRQQMLDKIETIPHTVDDFTLICEELQIVALQKKIMDLMNDERTKVKTEIKKLSESKNAANIYNKRVYDNYKGFNKRI